MRRPYAKLAQWDERLQTYRDGRRAYPTPAAAFAAATLPGRYRISTVTPMDGRVDGEAFEVTLPVAGARPPRKPKPTPKGGLRKYPGPWHHTGA